MGKSQSGPDSVEVKYYVYAAGWHLVPCAFAAESHLRRLLFNDQEAYSGDVSGVSSIYVNKPDLFGGYKREGGVVGTFTYMGGASTQSPNTYLQAKIGAGLTPAFRGVVSLIAERPELQTNNPFLKPPSLQLACYHGTWYPAKSKITASKVAYTTTQVPVDPDPDSDETLSCNWYEFSLGLCEIPGQTSPGIFDPDNVQPYPQDTDGFVLDGWIDTNPTPWDESTLSNASDWVYVGDTGGSDTKTYVDVTTSEVVVFEIGQNPAHIIREVAINKEWGRGLDPTELNDASFVAAADTLYAEGFGMSISWDAQVSVDAFLQLIVDHIGGNFSRNPVTNEYELRLFRPGQAVDLEIGPEQIVSFESYEETGWADAINEITVVYVDFEDGKEKSVTVHDLAAIERSGRVISETRTYRGLPTLELAERVARRDLAASVMRMQKAELIVDRSLFNAMDGMVASITWPDYDLDGLQLRVITVDHGTAMENEIYISAVSDINLEQFYPTMAEDPPPPPSSALEPFNVSPRGMMESPYWYYDRVKTSVGFFSDGLAADESALMAFGGSPQSNATGFLTKLSINQEDYVGGTSGSFCGVLQSLGGLTKTSTTILLDRTYRSSLDKFVPGVPLVLGRSELAQMVSLDITNWKMVVHRGLLDTVPQSFTNRFSIETLGYSDNGYFSHIVGLGDEVTVKLLTKTSKGILDIADASEISRTVTGRQARPLPPGNLLLNGVYLSHTIPNSTLGVAWKHRNRLTQTTDAQILQSDDNVTPEDGSNYILKIYGETGALALNETIPAAATPSYVYGTEVETLGYLQGKLKVELQSEREGLVSYTKWSHEIVREIEAIDVSENYDFSTGDLSSWTVVHGLPEAVPVGAVNLTNPSGSGYVLGNPSANQNGQWSAYQTINFASKSVSSVAVAYGTFGVKLEVLCRAVSGQPIGVISVAFYNDAGTLLRYEDSEQFYFQSGLWEAKDLVVPSVAEATKAVVGIRCYGVGGPNGGYVAKIQSTLIGRVSESLTGGIYPLEFTPTIAALLNHYASYDPATSVGTIWGSSSGSSGGNIVLGYSIDSTVEKLILSFKRTQSGSWYDDDFSDAAMLVHWMPLSAPASLTYNSNSWGYYKVDAQTGKPKIETRIHRTGPQPIDFSPSNATNWTETYLANLAGPFDGTRTLKFTAEKQGSGCKFALHEDEIEIGYATFDNEVFGTGYVEGCFILHFHSYSHISTETFSEIQLKKVIAGTQNTDYSDAVSLMYPYFWARFDDQTDYSLSGTEIIAAGATQTYSFAAAPTGGPTVIPQGLNGLTTASFDMTHNLQATDGHDQFVGAGCITLVAVYKSTRNDANYSSPINISVGSGADVTLAGAILSTDNSGIQKAGGRRRDSDSYVENTVSGGTFSEWNIGFAALDHENASLLNAVNGGTPATLSPFLTFGTKETAPTQIGIGGYPEDLTGYFVGELAEAIILPRLSTVERWLVEGYLAHKWGLTSKLPNDHLYKSIPPLHTGTDPLWEAVVCLYRFGDWYDHTENRYDLTPLNANVVLGGGPIYEVFGSSMEILASGSYAENASVPGPGTADFTIEGVVYIDSAIGNQDSWIFRIGNAGLFHSSVNNDLYFFDGVVDATCFSAGFTRDAPHHFAVVRNAGFVTVFLDGVPGTPLEITRDLSVAGLKIGSEASNGVSGMIGRVDILRYTLGVARYAGTYAVPTTPPPGLPVRPEDNQPQGTVVLDLEM